ncbi:MAG: ABC transporter permease [Coriobacteriia bacterium]
MNFYESFRIALKALSANKARAALTMLGVIIGVAAVIILVAIGSGVQSEVTGQIEGLGSNLIFVFPADFQSGGGGTVTRPFEVDDVELVERQLADQVVAVVPIVQFPVTIKHGNRSIRTVVAAGNEQGDEVFTSTIAEGRHFNGSEVDAAARVIALGDTVRTELFPGQNPIGKTVTVNGQRFRVLAYYEPVGGSFGGDQDNQVYMPYTTAQRLAGTDDISMMVVKVSDPDRIDLVKRRIRTLLEPKFGEDLSVFTQEQTLSILGDLLGMLTFAVAGIGGISLLVGGIGIMNIMLVSVSERTREIGIRKAVGARTYDILSQFIIEAVVLSVTGGLVGIALGAAVSYAAQDFVPTLVTWWAVATAFFFSAAVGVFFGVYPAWKASRLNPIDALRYE